MRVLMLFPLLVYYYSLSAQVSVDSVFRLWGQHEQGISAAQWADIRLHVQADIAKLATEKEMAKPLAVRVERVSEVLRQQWLKQYAADAAFGEIFQTGTYNCVTGTALYGLFFDALNIPYTIHELPTHVYAVVSPRKNPIRVECTNGEPTSVGMTYAAKYAYVTYLHKHGHIRAQEMNALSVEELFDKYFFAQKEISLHELRAIYWDNLGLYAAKNGDKQAAIGFAKRSYELRPTERSRFNLQIALENALSDASIKPELTGAYLAMWLPLESNAAEKSAFMLQKFQALGQAWLIERNAPMAYDALYAQLSAQTTDVSTRHALRLTYHLAYANRALLTADFAQAFAHADSAYLVNPADLRPQQLLRDCILESSRMADDFSALVSLGENIQDHPFLRMDAATRRIHAIAVLAAAQRAFRHDDIAAGEELLGYYEAQHFVLQESRSIGNAYWEAASAALRTQNTPLAQAYIRRGLVQSPNNAVLRQHQDLAPVAAN